MSDTVIKVENLSKQYRIGAREAGYRTFRETIVDSAKAPFQRIAKLFNRQSSIINRQSEETIWALRNVSFEVKRGEVIGIIGRNGAGKSTLLKILSKITEPTEGRVELRGRIGSLLEVGTGFHPELTGHENVYLYGAILGMDRWEITRKFDEIIAFAEMEKFIDTPVKRYSSGMYMRLAFAVAAHLEPEILLVDEVLAVGDAAFQKKCLGKMGEVSKEGRTVLFVSHNMTAIEFLCQRVLCINNGNIIADGLPYEVISLYLMKDAIGLSNVDLKSHPGRRQNMRPVLSVISLVASDGSHASTFRIGDQITIEIILDPKEDTFNYPSVSIAFYNHVGVLVCKLASWAQSQHHWQLGSRKKIRCIWPDCRLAPGKYYISIGFGNGPQVIDYIEQAAILDILPAELFGTGKIGSGLFLPDVEWIII